MKRIVIIAIVVAGLLIPAGYVAFFPPSYSSRTVPPYQPSAFTQQLGLQRLGSDLHFAYHGACNFVSDIFDPPRSRGSHPDDAPYIGTIPPKGEPGALGKFESKK